MRIKRIERGYTAFMTDLEYKTLTRILGQFDIDKEWPEMSVGERRSWSRRTSRGSYLRVDLDARVYKDT